MVLLSSADSQTLAPTLRFVNGDGDVTMFFFYFEIVAMRGKDKNEMTSELLS